MSEKRSQSLPGLQQETVDVGQGSVDVATTWIAARGRQRDALLQRRETARELLRRTKLAHREARRESRARLRALELLQSVAQIVQQRAHERIVKTVSACLSSVFDEPYAFRILFDRKRNHTQARLVFERDGVEFDPLTETGGGVVDVAAFALRVSCLALVRPQRRRLLVLDEPFRFVSEQYQGQVRMMLDQLARELGIQIVMVTHNKALISDNVIEI